MSSSRGVTVSSQFESCAGPGDLVPVDSMPLRDFLTALSPPRQSECFWTHFQKRVEREKEAVTKKEIVKQIADRIGLTQLKTKEIVQLTFDAIVDTLIADKRIELRNFGVFEVKQRKARKARNPRTGAKVDVPPKNVVTFKPGKEMEERVRQLTDVPVLTDDGNGLDEMSHAGRRKTTTPQP